MCEAFCSTNWMHIVVIQLLPPQHRCDDIPSKRGIRHFSKLSYCRRPGTISFLFIAEITWVHSPFYVVYKNNVATHVINGKKEKKNRQKCEITRRVWWRFAAARFRMLCICAVTVAWNFFLHDARSIPICIWKREIFIGFDRKFTNMVISRSSCEAAATSVVSDDAYIYIFFRFSCANDDAVGTQNEYMGRIDTHTHTYTKTIV